MQQESSSINLNILMQNAMEPTNKNILFLSKLKFKNSIYCAGDDIALKGEQQLYGKVMLMAKVPGIQFPVLLVNWYLQSKDPLIKEQGFTHLSKKELIFSDYSDWQYVESVKAKIRVISIETYQNLDPFAKTEERMFFCRNYILTQSPSMLNQVPKRVCLCRTLYNPDELLVCCTICGFAFHPRCSQNDELCLRCRWS